MLQKTISRAGRRGCCARCGSYDIRRVWVSNQDKVTCNVCEWVARPCRVYFPAYKTDGERVFAALFFLTAQTGQGVSRLDIARHLDISKNPKLIDVLEFHVRAGRAIKYVGVSPLNSRRVILYLPWTDADRSREARRTVETLPQGITAPDAPWKRTETL